MEASKPNCQACAVQQGTHQPAEALHQIAEPAAPVGKPIEDAIDALVMAAFTEGGCSEHRMTEARIQTELRKKELRTLLSTPQPCSRSHQHEEMTPMCELRTEIARPTNALARAEAQLAAAQPAAQVAATTGYIAPMSRYVPPVLFSPYTGEPRDARDIASDPRGILIVPPSAALAAQAKQGGA